MIKNGIFDFEFVSVFTHKKIFLVKGFNSLQKLLFVHIIGLVLKIGSPKITTHTLDTFMSVSSRISLPGSKSDQYYEKKLHKNHKYANKSISYSFKIMFL